MPTVAETVERFFSITQNRISTISNEGKHKTAWSQDSSLSKDYQSELDLIKPHYKPLIWGVGTAITLFATFRVSKYVSIARTRKQIGYTFEKIQSQKSPKEKFGDLASVPVDMVLSLLVGVSASLFLTDDEKLKKDFSNAPLVKGRSLIAEEFCSDYTKEFQKISPSTLQSKEAVESSSMRAIQNFVHNCERRNSIIDYREKEQMLDRSDAENLPSPVLEEINKRANQK